MGFTWPCSMGRAIPADRRPEHHDTRAARRPTGHGGIRADDRELRQSLARPIARLRSVGEWADRFRRS